MDKEGARIKGQTAQMTLQIDIADVTTDRKIMTHWLQWSTQLDSPKDILQEINKHPVHNSKLR